VNDYHEFIKRKTRTLKPQGFSVDSLPYDLFDWQRAVVLSSLQRGRAALFEDCGLGKTRQQLSWAAMVVKHTGRHVMLHCPVGVRQQTIREADACGIDVPVVAVNSGEDIPDAAGIVVTNYEKLHKFDPSQFAGVVLDESSILKSFTGSTKRGLIEAYAETPYRLACTATPAPNDYMELGNHAEFLGVMPSNEMLSRWFINDTMKAGGYRIKGHATADFWDWVASWATCLERPSDMGCFSDDGYELPPLRTQEHTVEIETKPDSRTGLLFGASMELNATSIHSVKRQSASSRADCVAELIAADESNGAWCVWCDTNYEADALLSAIRPIEPDVIEVRGSDKERDKERKLNQFSIGERRVIISKPEIAGFGMNWQHCRNTAFVGLSYSYERFYQAVRRIWRFGQTQAVNCHIVAADGEGCISQTIDRKRSEHEAMKAEMVLAMQRAQHSAARMELVRDKYSPQVEMEIPSWLLNV